MINNRNRQGSIGPVLVAVGSATVVILFLLGWYPQNWFKGLFNGSDKLALIGSFGDFKGGANIDIDDVARTIVGDLVSAQSNSKTENVKWGGCFRNPAGGDDFYDIVSNISVSPDDACTIGGSITHKSNIDLPKSIDFSAPADGRFTSVVFNLNGTTNSNKDIVLKITNGADNRFIIITPLGFITYGLTGSVGTAPIPAPTQTSITTTPTTFVNQDAVVRPSAPSNINASGNNGTVAISWDPPIFNGNAPITQYRVYRSFTSSGARSIAGTTTANDRSFTQSGLANGSTYYYHITAFNFLFEGPESAEVTAVTNGQTARPSTSPSSSSNDNEPGAPRNLSARAVSSSRIKLTWDEPRDDGGSSITEYRLYRSSRSNGSLTRIATIDEDTFSYTNTGLDEDTTYYYKILAVNREGQSNYSNQVSERTDSSNDNNSSNDDNDETPSAPRNVSADGGPNEIVLSWDAPANDGGSNIRQYRVYRSTSTTRPTNYFAAPTGRRYTDSYLSKNTTYYYWVSAVNSAGQGDFSGRVSATTDSAPSPSPSPTPAPSPAPAPSPSPSPAPAPQPTSTIPSAPNLSATPGQNQITLNYSVSNNGGSNIIAYRIYRSSSGSGTPTYISSTTNLSTFTNTGLSNGATYYYQVKAVNSVGESNFSNWASATTYAAPAPQPAPQPSPSPSPSPSPAPAPQPTSTIPSAPNLSATPGQNQITLNYSVSNQGSSAVSYYRIYRSTSANVEPSYITSTTNLSTFTNTGLSSGTTYYYYVAAVNQSGNGPYSNKASATSN